MMNENDIEFILSKLDQLDEFLHTAEIIEAVNASIPTPEQIKELQRAISIVSFENDKLACRLREDK